MTSQTAQKLGNI